MTGFIDIPTAGTFWLRDGRTAHIRPIRADDAELRRLDEQDRAAAIDDLAPGVFEDDAVGLLERAGTHLHGLLVGSEPRLDVGPHEVRFPKDDETLPAPGPAPGPSSGPAPGAPPNST